MNNLIVLDILLQNGIVQMKAENGIENIEKLWEMLHLLRISTENAIGAEMNLCTGNQLETLTALMTVSIKLTKNDIKVQLKKNVKYVEKNLQLTEQTELKHVEKNAQMSSINKLLTKIGLLKLVKSVMRFTQEQQAQNSVQKSVKKKQPIADAEKVRHLKVEPALSVESYLKAVTQELSTVGRTVEAVTIIGKSGKRKEIVYNFAVEGTQTYLVNGGVVVHNCDLVTQAIVSMNVHYPTHEAVHVNKDTHYYGTAGRVDYTSGSAYDSY